MIKVAIIEDDQAISQMYRIKFEAEGYSVETAENGKLGLRLIEKMRPDIILLDLMMPVMGGEEMLKELEAKQAKDKPKKEEQLSFFTPKEPPFVAELKSIDLDDLTPMQALQKIAAWQKLII